MAHYSELNSQNIVTAVRTAADEENFDGEKYFYEKYGTVHKRTSRNTRDGFHYDPVNHEISLDQSKAFRKNFGSVGSLYDEELDALFADAARIVVMHQQGSASLLQRKLKLGYNRAGRIIDQLEGMGIIGPFKGSKARDVLYSDENALEELLVSKGLV